MSRYNIDFNSHFWRTLPFYIQNKNDSLRFFFFRALLKFFYVDYMGKLNELFEQIFTDTMSYAALIKRAADIRIYPNIGETTSEFKKRFQREQLFRSYDLNKNAIIGIFGLHLGLEVEIIEVHSDDIFTIGITPLGEAGSYSSDYYLFTWKVILPDTTGIEYDKSEIIRSLNEYSCSSEFFIYEQRGNELIKWDI